MGRFREFYVRHRLLMLFAFLGFNLAFATWFIWSSDLRLYRSAPEGVNSYSWAFANLSPFSIGLLCYIVGHGSGLFIGCQLSHYWAAQGSPEQYAELVGLRDKVNDQAAWIAYLERNRG